MCFSLDFGFPSHTLIGVFTAEEVLEIYFTVIQLV